MAKLTAAKLLEDLGWWQKDPTDRWYNQYAWYKCPEYGSGADRWVDYDNPLLLLFDEKTKTVQMYWRYEDFEAYSKTEMDEVVRPVAEQMLKELGWTE